MLAIALALCASIAWGTSDFIGGLQSRRVAVPTVVLFAQIAGLSVLGVAVAVRADAPPDAVFIGWAALAALCVVVGLASLYRGLALGVMGIVAPISATGAILPVALDIAAGERPSTVQGVGMALAVVGVVLVAREPRTGRAHAGLAVGVGLALAAALGFGGFYTTLAAASHDDPYWATLVQRLFAVALVAAVVGVRRPGLRVPLRTLALLAALGILDASATVMLAVATTKELTGVVAVIASLYPVTTVALAAVFLRERLRASRAVGAVGTLAGVGLVAGG